MSGDGPTSMKILRSLLKDIANRPTPANFIANKPTKLVRDASDVGIRAVLEHLGSPVVYVLSLLIAGESGYSQTHKALFWAVCRLHKYLFSLGITITTDHKALQLLCNSDASVVKSMVAMVYRMIIALAAYS